MIVVLAAALVVLAGAVVLLFAMLGELTRRLAALDGGDRTPIVRPLDEARLGRRPEIWPGSLLQLSQDSQATSLVVLSTACSACERVALELATELDSGGTAVGGIVMSCADRRVGEDFMSRYGLGRLPSYVDEAGQWVTGTFGVRTSPSVLLFRGGSLDRAYVFSELATLRGLITSRQREVVAR